MNHNSKYSIVLLIGMSLVPCIGIGQGYSEVSAEAGITHLHIGPMLMGGGAAFIDFDRDGYEDLYLTGGVQADKLFRNNGDGTFTDVTSAAGIVGTDSVNTMGVVAGDLDNDGFKELFVTTWGSYHNLLFLNNGDGTFQDISVAGGIVDTALSVSATLGDVDKDGFVDIYVGNYIDLSIVAPNGFDYTCYANYLYINNGNNTFTESGITYGVADTGCALAVAFTDYDAERDLDVYIANDFGKWVLPNALYENNHPTSNYTDITLSAGVNDSIFGMGIAIGDYDEDGDLDYYITNLGRNVLRQNQGNGTFLDYTDTAGVTNTYTDSTFMAVGWGTAFFDYDNDTYLDLIVSNGYIPADSFIYNTPSNPNKLYRSSGTGIFQDISDMAGFNDTSIGRGLAIGDYNYDGAIDVVVGIVYNDTSSGTGTLLYKNEETPNNWIKISLEGVTTARDAFGSHITVYAGGRVFIREVDGGSSHLSHSSSIAHFGLGNITTVDSVVVEWLNGGMDTLWNVQVNQQIHIIEDSLFLTIHYQSLQICSGDSIIINSSYQSNPGLYHDTLTAAGYDSIVHTSLSFTPVVIDSVQNILCAGDSLYVGGAYQFTTGTYIDTLLGVSCDTTLVTQLTVLNPISNAISDSICSGEIYLGTAYANDTILLSSLVAANGCDSVVTINLTVLSGSTVLVDTAICEGALYFGVLYPASITITDTLTNSAGCDSITTTNLQVLNIDSTASTISMCAGDTLNGMAVNSDTIIVDISTGANGCDSISVTNVLVLQTYFIDSILNIAWGDSLNGFAIESDTVLLDTLTSIDGCDSVVQFTVTVGPQGAIGDLNNQKNHSVTCFPNPFTSELNIVISTVNEDNVQIIIEDLVGRRLAVIFDGTLWKGTRSFTWNGVTQSGYPVVPGSYICRVVSAHSSSFNQVMLLK